MTTRNRDINPEKRIEGVELIVLLTGLCLCSFLTGLVGFMFLNFFNGFTLAEYWLGLQLGSYRESSSHVQVQFYWGYSYGSALLRKVYSLAAVHASFRQFRWTHQITSCFRTPTTVNHVKSLFGKVQPFKQNSLLSVDIALMEASYWVSDLFEAKHVMVPSWAIQVGKEKYLGFIPMIFISCNELGNHALPPDTLWALIMLSLLIYHLDGYLESLEFIRHRS